MIITCSKCATRYEFDPSLLPSGEAPVECTTCHHVFIVTAPTQVLDLNPADRPQTEVPAPGFSDNSAESPNAPRDLGRVAVNSHESPLPMQQSPLVQKQEGRSAFRNWGWLFLVLVVVAIVLVGFFRQGSRRVETSKAMERELQRLRSDRPPDRVALFDSWANTEKANVQSREAPILALLASSLAWDDARILLQRVQFELDREKAHAKDNRKKILELEAQEKELRFQVSTWQSAAEKVFAVLKSGDAPSQDVVAEALFIAKGLYFSMQGVEPSPPPFSDEPHPSSKLWSSWYAILRAEWALNSTPSRSELLKTKEAMRQLREKEPTFVRAYTLEARASLLLRNAEAATASCEQLLLLVPDHEVAQALLTWSQELESASLAPAPSVSAP